MDTNKKHIASDAALPCGITPQQLAEWKTKYKEVFVITSVKEGKEYQGVFRKPGMDSFSKVLKYLAPDLKDPQAKEDGAIPRDMIRAGLIYFLDCKLAADEEMDNDDEIKAGVCIQLVLKFKAAQATIKNL